MASASPKKDHQSQLDVPSSVVRVSLRTANGESLMPIQQHSQDRIGFADITFREANDNGSERKFVLGFMYGVTLLGVASSILLTWLAW